MRTFMQCTLIIALFLVHGCASSTYDMAFDPKIPVNERLALANQLMESGKDPIVAIRIYSDIAMTADEGSSSFNSALSELLQYLGPGEINDLHTYAACRTLAVLSEKGFSSTPVLKNAHSKVIGLFQSQSIDYSQMVEFSSCIIEYYTSQASQNEPEFIKAVDILRKNAQAAKNRKPKFDAAETLLRLMHRNQTFNERDFTIASEAFIDLCAIKKADRISFDSANNLMDMIVDTNNTDLRNKFVETILNTASALAKAKDNYRIQTFFQKLEPIINQGETKLRLAWASSCIDAAGAKNYFDELPVPEAVAILADNLKNQKDNAHLQEIAEQYIQAADLMLKHSKTSAAAGLLKTAQDSVSEFNSDNQRYWAKTVYKAYARGAEVTWLKTDARKILKLQMNHYEPKVAYEAASSFIIKPVYQSPGERDEFQGATKKLLELASQQNDAIRNSAAREVIKAADILIGDENGLIASKLLAAIIKIPDDEIALKSAAVTLKSVSCNRAPDQAVVDRATDRLVGLSEKSKNLKLRDSAKYELASYWIHERTLRLITGKKYFNQAVGYILDMMEHLDKGMRQKATNKVIDAGNILISAGEGNEAAGLFVRAIKSSDDKIKLKCAQAILESGSCRIKPNDSYTKTATDTLKKLSQNSRSEVRDEAKQVIAQYGLSLAK